MAAASRSAGANLAADYQALAAALNAWAVAVTNQLAAGTFQSRLRSALGIPLITSALSATGSPFNFGFGNVGSSNLGQRQHR